ncbi:MAG: hypothetical protein ACLSHJ_12340 [Oscillospiraceae bacterium]
MTAEETDAVYALLDALQYKRLGVCVSNAGLLCKALFYQRRGQNSCEIMLSEREMLVNPITGGKAARLYELRSGSAELRDYLLECISASNAAEEDFSISGTVFSYGGESWDLAEQSPAITSLLGCDAVGQYVVITGHGGPKNAFYFIFDTEIRRFSNAFVGTHLVWQNDDLSTAVYAYGGNILSIDGRTLAELDLAENEYVYDLVYSQDGTVLTVAIVSNEETERIVRLTLPIQDEIDDLRGDAEKSRLMRHRCGSDSSMHWIRRMPFTSSPTSSTAISPKAPSPMRNTLTRFAPCFRQIEPANDVEWPAKEERFILSNASFMLLSGHDAEDLATADCVTMTPRYYILTDHDNERTLIFVHNGGKSYGNENYQLIGKLPFTGLDYTIAMDRRLQ